MSVNVTHSKDEHIIFFSNQYYGEKRDLSLVSFNGHQNYIISIASCSASN